MANNNNFVPDRRRVRIGTAQYHMHSVSSWENIETKIMFFAKQADKNRCQFLLLPEYFGIQYFSCLPKEWSGREKLMALTEKYDRYLEVFKTLAGDYQIFIIGGSHPVVKAEEQVYNIAHLFTPNGNVYTQEKLHVTPTERRAWNYIGGNSLRLFDTPYGRIAIQVCYDIEFPEISRLLVLSGAEIIFNPFFTSDLYGYQRIRYSAQARAVENYVYTVISGSHGNLQETMNFTCYSQSAIFTPSDLGFPYTAVASETPLNNETVVVADLDLEYLQEVRANGTVNPLLDRRSDLYSIQLNTPIEVVQVE